MTDAFSLKGRSALITGGSTGIGAAIAAALQDAGATCCVTTRESPVEPILAGRVSEIGMDLSDLDADKASDLMKRAERQVGEISILVNAAGIIRREDAVTHSSQNWHDVMRVNLDATWFLCQAAGRGMLERKSGNIINIASLLSFQGGIRVPSYTSSKHAVAGLTKALCCEWAGSGVNVNAIAPGYVLTKATDALVNDPVRSKDILGRIPAGMWGEPAHIANAAVFLASPASSYVNGHTLVVDGGWLAR